MREILFRGKTESGKWVQGDLIQLANGLKFIINNKFGACIDDKGNFINTEAPFVCEVIPSTVGQYTGLTDKNGTKIFEGDILSVTVQEYEDCPDDWQYNFVGSKRRYTGRKIKAVWTVEHKNHFCKGIGFYLYGKDRRFHIQLTQSALFNANAEVVGNIHDNPELLEGAK